jgi:hypothetical protein
MANYELSHVAVLEAESIRDRLAADLGVRVVVASVQAIFSFRDGAGGWDPKNQRVRRVVRPVSRSHGDDRGYAGQVAGGVLRKGDEIAVLPTGRRCRIAGARAAGCSSTTTAATARPAASS